MNLILFRLSQVTMNGYTCMSPEPMLEGKKSNTAHTEKELWKLQNGKLKSGLTDRLSTYQERLDILGKFNLYFNLFFIH